jgi:hypothetical protein
MTRTAQDILAERRATVFELARETDPTARAMLQFAIDQLDRELAERTIPRVTVDADQMWRP